MDIPSMPKIEKVPSVALPNKPKSNKTPNKNNTYSEQIKKVLRSKGYDIWSYSRFSSSKNCAFEYYMQYVERDREKLKKKRDNVYSLLGGIVHDCLENYFNGNIKKHEMCEKFDFIYNQTKIPTVDQSATLVFPNPNIEKDYIECLRLFFRDYELPTAPIRRNEDFVWELFNNNKIAVQGFIDLVLGYIDEDGNKYAVIQDFKTSTKFSNNDLLEKGRQLVLYAHMYHKRTGIPVKRVEWNMLKYAEVTFPKELSELNKKKVSELKEIIGGNVKGNKKELIKEIIQKKIYSTESKKIVYKRNEIYMKMNKEIEKYLIQCDIPQEVINRNLELFKKYQNIKYLDKDTFALLTSLGFKQEDYIKEYNLTQEIYDEMENFLITTEHKLTSMPDLTGASLEKIIKSYPQKLTNMNDGDFYCTNLCSFAKDKYGQATLCPFYKNYINNLRK